MTAQAQFKNVHKGDIIEIGGVKAMVFFVSGDGHGSAITVDVFRGSKSPWCIKKKIAEDVSCTSLSDGMANTQAIYDYVKQKGISLSTFPVFEWCHSLGDSWYIPSMKQMETFVNFFLGNDQEYDWDSEEEYEMGDGIDQKELNNRLLDADGFPFSSSTFSGSFAKIGVYTSSKTDDNDVYMYEMNSSKNTWRFRKVSVSSLGTFTTGRAVIDF